MRKKGIAAALLACSILWCTAFAASAQPMICEANFYQGTLYYCDAERGQLVLKGVNAIGTVNQENTRTAVEAEYTELPIGGPVTLKDGTAISLADCNYYPDSEVRVLITRSNDGSLRVVQMRFL